jgi:hypothetical protein
MKRQAEQMKKNRCGEKTIFEMVDLIAIPFLIVRIASCLINNRKLSYRRRYSDALLRIFAQVPEVEALGPELVDELLEFAFLPAFPEHLVVAENHEMILRDGSLL